MLWLDPPVSQTGQPLCVIALHTHPIRQNAYRYSIDLQNLAPIPAKTQQIKRYSWLHTSASCSERRAAYSFTLLMKSSLLTKITYAGGLCLERFNDD
jgi:hypothetical protein